MSTRTSLGSAPSTARWANLIFLPGIAVLSFLPETKDQPLPEE